MNITLKIKKIGATGEYRVGYYENGNLNDNKSYYTDDRQDAYDTEKCMQEEIDGKKDHGFLPDFEPGLAPMIEIETAYPKVKELEIAANEMLAEYNHGTAEFADCAGVTGVQYSAVIEDFLLHLNGEIDMATKMLAPYKDKS